MQDKFIEDLLIPYGVRADHHLCEKIRTYTRTLLLWNKRISLTTVTEQPEILKFHFGESFFGATVVPINKGRLADVGSGAGFPGIPIRILVPGIELTLIESNAKKCAFLSEIARSLELEKIRVLHSRMEDVPATESPFDFITARALGQHRKLLAWAPEHLSESGKVVLWLGEDDAEDISRCRGWIWSSPVLIPGSKKRFVLAGSPQR